MVDLTLGVDVGAHAVTPELAPVAMSGVPCDCPGSVGDKPAKLFDIFRPTSQRKVCLSGFEEVGWGHSVSCCQPWRLQLLRNQIVVVRTNICGYHSSCTPHASPCLQYLIVIRHGESEYNKAIVESKSYADPMIFDPRLTQKGLQQVMDV